MVNESLSIGLHGNEKHFINTYEDSYLDNNMRDVRKEHENDRR